MKRGELTEVLIFNDVPSVPLYKTPEKHFLKTSYQLLYFKYPLFIQVSYAEQYNKGKGKAKSSGSGLYIRR